MNQKYLLIYLILWLFIFGSSLEAKQNDLHKSLESEMAWIPPGKFTFGTNLNDRNGQALSFGVPKPWYADESPRQKIFLKEFYLDRFEVTNQRYKVFVDAVSAVAPPYWKNNAYPNGLKNYPVVWVTWYDASNFCSWAGKRLPSEKEWERAAKGSKDYNYPWGNEFDIKRANLAIRAGSKNTVGSVGSHPGGASLEGVNDLIGNAWEWTADNYLPYKGNTFVSKKFNDGSKVLRGVSASYLGHFPGPTYAIVLEKMARSGFRQPAFPDQSSEDVGFRCASGTKPKFLLETTNTSKKNLQQSMSSNSLKSISTVTNSSVNENNVSPEKFNPFEAKSNLPKSNIIVLILLSFIAGLLSFLSPCTLPILPAYFAVTAQAERARVTFMSFAFFCGLASLFVLMGASASFLGKFLRDYMFPLTTLGGIFVILFGLMTLFGKGFSGAAFKTQPTSTFIGSFLFGATFALGWTPCVGPVLSGILILAASDKTVLQGMSLLFFYAVGLGMPLITIAVFFSSLKKDSLFWRILRGQGWEIQVSGNTILLHSTNLLSGLLLIGLGLALAFGYMTYLNSIIPIELQVWFSKFEEELLTSFM